MHLASLTLHPERFPARDRYPFSLPNLQRLGTLAFDAPVTFFVGENGSGKSTLLEAMAVRCGIHIWRDESRLRVEHNRWERRLAEFLDVTWPNGKVPGSFFGADIFRNFAQMLDEWAASDPGQLEYFGGHSLLTLSHGQSLLAFFRSRYRIKGLYLLDEPESALSPRSLLELLGILAREGAAGHAQFIVATHSPILLACPGAAIWCFDEAPPRRVAYEQTELVRLYPAFLADPERHLRDAAPPKA
jgi:predicted ATPase